MGEEGHLNIETLIAIFILLIYTVAAPIFDKIHFHYMHESGLCMIIGVIISLLATLMNPNANFTHSLNFNGDVFFTFVLPPIIFSAGYNLRRATFFKYFIYILSFGVIGTIMSFLWISPFTLLFNSMNLFYIPIKQNNFTNETYNNVKLFYETNMTIDNNTLTEIKENGYFSSSILENFTYNFYENKNEISSFLQLINESITESDNTTLNPILESKPIKKVIINFSTAEILLFASVISATDTIAALTFIHEDTEPKLFAILFGEGVMNDAVCIVLYRILALFMKTGQEFTSGTALSMFNQFLALFFFSFCVGMLMGMFCAWLLKFFKKNGINLNRTQEIAVILFFAFLSYTLAEEMSLSPIVTLLFCGIFMANYAFYNLSFQAREESSVVSRLLSNVAEAFVFTYLGLTLIGYIKNSLCLSYIIIELFVVVCGRIFAIFGLCYIFHICGVKNFKMKTSQKGIMSCAGSIRGAIAFGLAISIETSNTLHKEILISSTIILVFFSTIVFGALMPFMINIMKKLDPPETAVEVLEPDPDELLKCDHFNFCHPNFSEKYEGSKEKNVEILKTRVSYWLGHYWVEFDDMIIKPWLCYQWPWVQEDCMNVKKVILKSLQKYENEQKLIPHYIRGEKKKEDSNNIDNIKNKLLNKDEEIQEQKEIVNDINNNINEENYDLSKKSIELKLLQTENK